MLQSELLKLKHGIEKAQEDTTPVAIVDDDALKVIGDANKTENKFFDYKVKFIFPMSLDNQIKGEKTYKDGRIETYVEFKNITITPRKNIKVQAKLITLLPLFYKVDETKKISEMTDAEFVDFTKVFTDDVIDAIYDLVATALEIDPMFLDYMDAISATGVMVKLVQDFPEIINEADFS